MNFTEYQQSALRTASADRAPDLALGIFGLGLCGESLELIQAILNGESIEAQTKEVGDVLWYLAVMADAFGVTYLSLEDTSTSRGRISSATVVMHRACRLAELIKKQIGHGKPADKYEVCQLMIVLVKALAVASPVPLSLAAELNVAKLKARYPEGFSVETAAAL